MKYYIINENEEQSGPFELEQLADEGVYPETYVWCKGMSDWQQAADVSEICRYWRNRLYDIMHPTSDTQESHDKFQSQQDAININRFTNNIVGQAPLVEDMKPDTNTKPADTMWISVLVTLFCSVIGFIAIYYSYQTNKNWNMGNNEIAHEMSRRAKMWIGISLFTGFMMIGMIMMKLF